MSKRLTYIFLFLLNTLVFNVLSASSMDDSRIVIPFQVINGLIIVEAEIDNQVGNYIFDTGAEELILNREARSGKTLFSSINGDLATEEVDVNLLKIGNLTHSMIKAYSTDLGSMESYLNISLHGVIGCSIFIPRKVKIDFDTNEITLSSADDLATSRTPFVSFEMVDGTPVCPIDVNGQMYLFGFDTGATMHVFDQSLYFQTKENFEDTGLDTYVSTGTGEKTVNKIMSLNSFLLGNQDIKDTHFLIQDLTAFNESMKQPISGVLSLTALDSDSIIIDLENKRIYF